MVENTHLLLKNGFYLAPENLVLFVTFLQQHFMTFDKKILFFWLILTGFFGNGSTRLDIIYIYTRKLKKYLKYSTNLFRFRWGVPTHLCCLLYIKCPTTSQLLTCSVYITFATNVVYWSCRVPVTRFVLQHRVSCCLVFRGIHMPRQGREHCFK